MNTNHISTIVVEDERLPRLALLQKLEAFYPIIEVVDSCDSYSRALSSILRLKPQLIFLDIQLQGQNAMQLLEELKTLMPLPYVIFTTAYNERDYLLRAIKLQAVDYLLKPIGQDELELAIGKVVKLLEQNVDDEEEQPEKCWFRTATGHLFASVEDIVYIRSDGNYSVVVTTTDQVMVMESLLAIERRLKSVLFLRVDRKNIINKKMFYKINSQNNTCLFLAANGSKYELRLSKRGVETLLEVMAS